MITLSLKMMIMLIINRHIMMVCNNNIILLKYLYVSVWLKSHAYLIITSYRRPNWEEFSHT